MGSVSKFGCAKKMKKSDFSKVKNKKLKILVVFEIFIKWVLKNRKF